jgi:hypothetical protein
MRIDPSLDIQDKETSWDDFDAEKEPGDNADLCARLSQLQTDKETLIREKDDLREQVLASVQLTFPDSAR